MNPSNHPATSALQDLQDIHLPSHVSAWPPAFGWWLLALLIIGGVTITILAIKRYRKKWGYRKAALRLLKQTYQQWNNTHKHKPMHSDRLNNIAAPNALQHTSQMLMETLKRCAIVAYPNIALSGLHGKEWISFLNQQTRQPYFNETLRTMILEQQYQAKPTIDIEPLYKACQQWVKQHRTQASALTHASTSHQQEEASQC